MPLQWHGLANPQHYHPSELTMAEWKEETFNYEILLRFGDSGPNKGRLTGASRTTITQTTKDGVPIAGGTNINPPEQLALVAVEEGKMLSDVLGEVNAQTIIQNQTLAAALESEQGRTSELSGDLIHAKALAQESAAQFAAARAEIARLTASMASPLSSPTEAIDGNVQNA